MDQLHSSPRPLSAAVIGSFAYLTVKDRIPVILTRVIDYLCRNKPTIISEHGEGSSSSELKAVIGKLSRLKNEMQTNKPLRAFEQLDPTPEYDDTAVWNSVLEEYSEINGGVDDGCNDSQSPCWFTAPWLLVECYMYKSIHHYLQASTSLRDLDPFKCEKQESLEQSKEAILTLQQHTLAVLENIDNASDERLHAAITTLLQASVWGNQCDLSLTSGKAIGASKQGGCVVNVVPPADADHAHIVTDADHVHIVTDADHAHIVTDADNRNNCCDDNRNADRSTKSNESSRNDEDSSDGHCNTNRNESSRNDDDSNTADNSSNADGSSDSKSRLESWVLSMRDNLVVDDSKRVCEVLRKTTPQQHDHVALVLDNAGYELLTDVCLSLLLLKAGLASKVLVYVKTRPWFVSDTLHSDVHSTLRWLSSEGLRDQSGGSLYELWNEAINSGAWSVREHSYWTTPHSFHCMKTSSPQLYDELSRAKMIIFKGDLNYRKLTADLNWPNDTPFSTALGESLASIGPVLALRTVKGGPVVGAREKEVERMMEKFGEDHWDTGGQCGMVQLSLPSDVHNAVPSDST